MASSFPTKMVRMEYKNGSGYGTKMQNKLVLPPEYRKPSPLKVNKRYSAKATDIPRRHGTGLVPATKR